VANPQNLIPFNKGYDERRGGKPKGAIHLSTMIQNYLNEDIEPENLDPKKVGKTRMAALVATAYIKADGGDNKWAEWLARYGYGTKMEVQHSGEIATGNNDPELAKDFTEYMKAKTKA
jgi:hypothetical protein